MTTDLAVLDTAIKKVHYHEVRQKVLAQNIANADTAGYKPEDLVPVDFKKMLESSSSHRSLVAARSNGRHIALAPSDGPADSIVIKRQKETYETSPSGNAVVLEEQLMKQNENAVDHQMSLMIYQKNMDFLKRATKSAQ